MLITQCFEFGKFQRDCWNIWNVGVNIENNDEYSYEEGNESEDTDNLLEI